MNAVAPMSSYTAASGVWPTSSPVAFDEYAVFCVGNNKVREAAFKAWAVAHGIGFKELVGAYKGVTETSFIVNVKSLPRIMRDVRLDGEESILLLGPRYREGRMHGDRLARLWFPAENRTVPIGHFREASKAYAMSRDGWTFDPSDETYWVAE